MVVPLSPPLSRYLVAGLSAGDDVVLTGPVLLLRCDQDTDPVAGDGSAERNEGVYPEPIEGSVCCLVAASAGDGARGWQIARIDQSPVDRVVRALLPTGVRGIIAAGHCPATASYALRKYGAVFFAVAPDWLASACHSLPAVGAPIDTPGRLVTILELDHAPLTVAHDTQGRSVWEGGSHQDRLG